MGLCIGQDLYCSSGWKWRFLIFLLFHGQGWPQKHLYLSRTLEQGWRWLSRGAWTCAVWHKDSQVFSYAGLQLSSRKSQHSMCATLKNAISGKKESKNTWYKDNFISLFFGILLTNRLKKKKALIWGMFLHVPCCTSFLLEIQGWG